MEQVFFLGKRDLEMSRIAELLRIRHQKFYTPKNNGRVHVSDYADEIKENAGRRLIFIGLTVDIPIPEGSIILSRGDIWPRSLLFKTCDLIGHKPLNVDMFIAVNAYEGRQGMLNVGASLADVAMIQTAEAMLKEKNHRID